MSVFVYVRQFFNQDGLKAFPALFEEHRRSVSAFSGFISLQHSPPSKSDSNGATSNPWLGKDTIDVSLEFENELLLKEWRSSSQHEQVAAAYRRYWTREPEIVFGSVA